MDRADKLAKFLEDAYGTGERFIKSDMLSPAVSSSSTKEDIEDRLSMLNDDIDALMSKRESLEQYLELCELLDIEPNRTPDNVISHPSQTRRRLSHIKNGSPVPDGSHVNATSRLFNFRITEDKLLPLQSMLKERDLSVGGVLNAYIDYLLD